MGAKVVHFHSNSVALIIALFPFNVTATFQTCQVDYGVFCATYKHLDAAFGGTTIMSRSHYTTQGRQVERK